VSQAELAARLEADASAAQSAGGEREANLRRELSEAQSRISQLEEDLVVQTREATDMRAQLVEATSERERLRAEVASLKEALGATQARLAVAD
jgi:chromosome segregation ATPase